ncbi:MAG: hypothetical protein A2Y15_00235 [Clostridiales bacterium GWF2_36_10]|nr:MAG: hypothetical protein A2Y15_00235 [Clostridiales bacterium GWF2_36_10]HAN21782.1 DUF2194 domain-containing protein [Clostridiales bacterium]
MINKARMRILLVPFLVLILMALLLLAERTGLQFKSEANDVLFLPKSVTSIMRAEQEDECLMLVDSASDITLVFRKQMEDVLDSMRIGYDVVDASSNSLPELDKYRTVVITFSNLDILSDDIMELFEWVDDGGGLMLCCAPSPTTVFQVIKQKLGILESGYSYVNVEGMQFTSDFMIGAKGISYMWDTAWEASLGVNLLESCNVHVTSIGDNSAPMVWDYRYGNGKVVVNNHSVVDKGARGLFAATYSLLEDVIAYPVINSSTFFLDDFPAPVPMGDATYISRDYNRSIESFYSNIWWPDVLEIADKYGITYTGVVIENYYDSTEEPFTRNMDIERFSYFGGMLLENGGEIGIHGYNHQPLVTSAFVYDDSINYNTWENMDLMTMSLNELVGFTKSLFPDTNISVYVPPSNILSNEGRQVLGTRLPGLRCIASVYVAEDIQFEQEFEVSADGIINLPRIIAGCLIDEYMEWAAMNELNFHFVNNHFMHPDDVLDVDRGAALGWEAMKKDFDSYLTWLYDTAPTIRNLNATQAAAAVERYDYLSVKREISDSKYKLSLGGFYDTAYLMLRFNNGEPGKVDGGTIEHLEGNLYLLCASQAEITIEIIK